VRAASSARSVGGRSAGDSRSTVPVVGSASWYASGCGSGVISPDDRRPGVLSADSGAGDGRTRSGDGRDPGTGDGRPGSGEGRDPGGDGRDPGAGDGRDPGAGDPRGAGWLASSVASSAWHGTSPGASSRMLRHTVIACCERP
jgi:hypothetical protein